MRGAELGELLVVANSEQDMATKGADLVDVTRGELEELSGHVLDYGDEADGSSGIVEERGAGKL